MGAVFTSKTMLVRSWRVRLTDALSHGASILRKKRLRVLNPRSVGVSHGSELYQL